MPDHISVVIITRDAGATLRDTLDSTSTFGDVVVYDNGSSDDTLEIAAGYPNVTIHRGDFMGFGPTRNHALSLAKNDWVLSLDADEVLSPELCGYLETWRPEDEFTVGLIRRDNFLMGRHVDKGGWGADWLARLFNRREHRFNNLKVHEKLELNDGSIEEKLPYPMRHNAVQHLGQFLTKIDRYSEIHREQKTRTFHPLLITLRSFFAFIRSYVFKGGMFAGWRGLVIAWNEANGVFYKYMKPYADQHL